MTGTVEGRAVALGNLKLFEELHIDAGDLPARAEALRSDGQTVMLLAIDGKAAGLIGVADPVKESTAEAIRALHAEGVQVIMLTGDNRITAEAVAKKLGIDRIRYQPKTLCTIQDLPSTCRLSLLHKHIEKNLSVLFFLGQIVMGH